MGRTWWLALGWLAASSAWAVEVHDVRLWRAPDHTRIVLDLSGPADHKLIVLDNPSRVVLDVADTRLRTGLDKLELDNTPVRRIRSGVREGDDLRLVLEMSAVVNPRSFALKANDQAGDRLVLDLYDEAGRATTVKKSVSQSAKRDIIIAIDAGHGGEDPCSAGHRAGAQSPVRG
jgi:N-acetylmuramoyl-L-alanine amidase